MAYAVKDAKILKVMLQRMRALGRRHAGSSRPKIETMKALFRYEPKACHFYTALQFSFITCLAPSSWYQLPGTRYWYQRLVPGASYHGPDTWYQVFDTTWYQIPGTWFQVPRARCQAPGIWYQVPGAKYCYQMPGPEGLVPCARYLVPNTLYQVPASW